MEKLTCIERNLITFLLGLSVVSSGIFAWGGCAEKAPAKLEASAPREAPPPGTAKPDSASSLEKAPIKKDTLVQYALLDGLLVGHYEGIETLAEIKKQGDHGIGTFDRLDGEMILYKGKVYQVKADGSVIVPQDTLRTPFAAVSRFDPSIQLEAANVESYDALKEKLNPLLENRNIFYAIEVTGDFSYVHTRSVPAQKKPYKPLSEIVRTQPRFERSDIKGTLVGYWCPKFVKGINAPEYHLHFISEDRSFGGHVLDVKIKKGTVMIDPLLTFELHLPTTEAFARESFDKDMTKATAAVEGGR